MPGVKERSRSRTGRSAPRLRGRIALCSLLTLALSVIGVTAGSGEEQRLSIENIEAGLADGRLMVSAQFRDLFSRKIVSTIQSGLSAIVHVDVRLLEASTVKSMFSSKDDKFKNVYHTELVRSISYNIWNERYAVSADDETVIFAGLVEAKEAISRIEQEGLVEVSRLRPMAEYTIKMRVQVVPISAAQGDRIADWLRDPNRLDEELGTKEQSREFQFNVSELIATFWGKKKQARNSSAWQMSEPFRISDSGGLLK